MFCNQFIVLLCISLPLCRGIVLWILIARLHLHLSEWTDLYWLITNNPQFHKRTDIFNSLDSFTHLASCTFVWTQIKTKFIPQTFTPSLFFVDPHTFVFSLNRSNICERFYHKRRSQSGSNWIRVWFVCKGKTLTYRSIVGSWDNIKQKKEQKQKWLWLLVVLASNNITCKQMLICWIQTNAESYLHQLVMVVVIP